jgi:hypothetical protein
LSKRVITYQGRLIDNNQSAGGLYDFQFKLYDAASDGGSVQASKRKFELAFDKPARTRNRNRLRRRNS